MTCRAGSMLALLAILLGACGGDEPVESTATPERIVTLAPHLAEIMYAIDAGDLLVGVSAWSDHPEPVKSLPVVGDAFTIDHEQLALLEPDLLLAWESGMPAHIVDELRRAGFRVELVRTRGLGDISKAMRALGDIVERPVSAEVAATGFEMGLEGLGQGYESAVPIRVFYQVSDRPLFTVSDAHFLGEIVSLCGGVNIFADLDEIAPSVSDEAVIARDPEVMIATDADEHDPFSEWQRWPRIAANRYGNHFRISADTSSRPTQRLLGAAVEICAAIDTGRRNRTASSPP
jgi:iron complex transport system substrate-binding protein